MGGLSRLMMVMEKVHEQADFVFIYILEAHPAEKKHFDYSNKAIHKIYSHKTLEERIQAAEILNEKLGEECTLLVDGLDNAADSAYAAKPDRIYIVKNGKIEFIGAPGPLSINPEALEMRLRDTLTN